MFTEAYDRDVPVKKKKKEEKKNKQQICFIPSHALETITSCYLDHHQSSTSE